MDIANLDLNLLKIFDAVLHYQTVNEAADKLHISQSACSHGLARLRERLNDELFIRTNNKMVPTEKAIQLAESVIPAMQMLNQGLAASIPFEPSIGNHSVVLSGTDFTTWTLLPTLARYLAQHYPNISVRVVHTDQRVPQQMLEQGEIDFALAFAHQSESPNHICHQLWLDDAYCTVACINNPVLKNQATLTVDDFTHLDHVVVTPWNERTAIVDEQLAKLNRKRKIALQVPSVLSAPYLIPNTPYLLTIPRIYVEPLTDKLGLKIYQPAITIPNYQIKLYWHKARETNGKLVWFRQLLEALEKEAINSQSLRI